MECIITPYFWTALWPGIRDSAQVQGHPLRKLGACFDHSVPITLLFIDWAFFSCKPFLKRHFVGACTIAIFYLFFNFLDTKIVGVPVYPAMTWKGVIGYVVPLCFIPYGLFVFTVLYILTYLKLHLLGHNEITYLIKYGRLVDEQVPTFYSFIWKELEQ